MGKVEKSDVVAAEGGTPWDVGGDQEPGSEAAAAAAAAAEDGIEGDDVEEGDENIPQDEDQEEEEAELPYQPKAPPRSPAPAVFKAWRQDNHGSMMTQAVVQDDTEALVWMLQHELVDLAETNDLGNTAAHLAVFHDSPGVLRLLHELGLDMSATCDAESFGSAIFYSVHLGRVQCLEELIALGYDMSPPCDRFGRTPEMVARRHDQGAALDVIRRSLAAVELQRVLRGMFGRRKATQARTASSKIAVGGDAEETAVEEEDAGEIAVEGGVEGAVEWAV